jgi:hypothetical protein
MTEIRGTGHGEAKQGREDGKKRTCVDSEHDHWNHEDNLSLVRTQDPSPPHDDAIRDDKLDQNSRKRVRSWRVLVDDVTLLTLMRRMSNNVDSQADAERLVRIAATSRRMQEGELLLPSHIVTLLFNESTY